MKRDMHSKSGMWSINVFVMRQLEEISKNDGTSVHRRTNSLSRGICGKRKFTHYDYSCKNSQLKRKQMLANVAGGSRNRELSCPRSRGPPVETHQTQQVDNVSLPRDATQRHCDYPPPRGAGQGAWNIMLDSGSMLSL